LIAAAAAVAPADDFESDKQRKSDSDRVIDEILCNQCFFFHFWVSKFWQILTQKIAKFVGFTLEKKIPPTSS
jgi:hypothetical protein